MTPATIIFLKYLGSVVLAITLWYKDVIAIKLGIKKGKKSLEDSSLNNLQKNLDIYQEMVSDIDIRYKNRLKEIEETFNYSVKRLQGEVEKLRAINNELVEIIDNQKQIITKQSKSLDYYKKKYGDTDDSK